MSIPNHDWLVVRGCQPSPATVLTIKVSKPPVSSVWCPFRGTPAQLQRPLRHTSATTAQTTTSRLAERIRVAQSRHKQRPRVGAMRDALSVPIYIQNPAPNCNSPDSTHLQKYMIQAHHATATGSGSCSTELRHGPLRRTMPPAGPMHAGTIGTASDVGHFSPMEPQRTAPGCRPATRHRPCRAGHA